MADIKIQFLFDMASDLDRQGIINVGTTPHGNRGTICTTGALIEGSKVKATVFPGVGDGVFGRIDGTSALDVRAAARTDDGDIIDIKRNSGL